MTGHFQKRRLVLLSASLWASTLYAAESRVALQNLIPQQLHQATQMSAVAADEPIHLSLIVKLDPTLLAQTLDAIYGRNAPAKKHFLSSGEFAERFGLDEKRQKLQAFALANGLTLDPNNSQTESMVVKVSGRADVIEKAFGVQLNYYRSVDGKMFRAHEGDPLIPEALSPHLSAILGLSNLSGLIRPQLRFAHLNNRSGTASASNETAIPSIAGATGPNGGLAPADIKTIYKLDSLALTGAGQTVALFELDGYNPTDITAYTSHFSLGTVPVTYVPVDGTPNLCAGMSCASQNITTDPNMVEVALDIEMVAALAPGVSNILVYNDANTAQGAYDIYDQIATDNVAKVVSTSWDLDEPDAGLTFVQAENQLFQRMAAQGQSMYSASGDDGAYNGLGTVNVDDPASQPYVTGVGGTTLSGTLQAPVETTWNDGSNSSTGGGVSMFWPIPTYQVGLAGVYSTTMRNVPDVALNADPNSGYSIYVGGSWFPGVVGGTSAAAPLWAGFTALLNQQSNTLGDGNLGSANAVFYQQAAGSTYHSLFTDITTGTNNFYHAGAGYDNVTGLGSYLGATLINSITGQLGTIAENTLLESLSNVYAFPNPWDVRKNPPAVVTIQNVPNGATIKIFTVSGFHVTDLTASNKIATWDLKNSSGKDVASGLYLYFVKYNDNVFRGKIAVIR